MQRAFKIFDQEIEALKEKTGEEAAARALLVFSEATHWLREWGHGDLTISAVNHIFGLKIRANTVICIKSKMIR